jgi:hypothetical protein
MIFESGVHKGADALRQLSEKVEWKLFFIVIIIWLQRFIHPILKLSTLTQGPK